MVGSLKRIYDIAVWQGPAGLATRVLGLAGFRVLYWYVLPRLNTTQPPLAPTAATPATIAELGLGDLDAYLAFRRGATPEQFRARFERAARCYAARVGGAIVSASWVATGRARVEGFQEDFELDSKQMYLFDSFTLPAHRGQRLQSAIFAAISRDYAARGVEQALMLTGPENRANQASRSRSGFVRTGGVTRLVLGPLRWGFSWGRRGL